MKKYISLVTLLVLLAGCEDAAKTIDKAQDIANNAVDSLQEKAESVNLGDFNLDKINDIADSGKSLVASIEKAMTVDFTDPQALTEVKESISNAYSCVIEASSESNAQKIMEQITSEITNESIKSLIDSGVEKAKEAQKCIM